MKRCSESNHVLFPTTSVHTDALNSSMNSLGSKVGKLAFAFFASPDVVEAITTALATFAGGAF